jgi:protein-tyrosine kinase
MSTIERAAARLGSIGKRDKRPDGERTEPALPALDGASPGEPVATEPSITTSAQAVAPEPAAVSSGIKPTMFVGGGYVDLDVDKLAAMGFVVVANVDSELATDFRRIKRPLLLAVKKAESDGGENPANLIVVTSAVPGEGKTFTSVNLALSIATEVDMSVLLVDGDVAKSSIIDVLDVRSDLGLTDVVARGGTHIDDAVLKTNIEGLELMTSGPRLPHTDELFASEQMRRAMHELARANPRRLVLVDGPPLLARTEAPNLARLAGHVVVVVEADKTPQSNVTEALGLLAGCERVSLVLNKVTRRAFDRHAYGYGYGYGHAPRGY